jgi:prevent-host-death family protein
VALAKVKDDLSRYLRLAEGQEIVITRHGRPAGVLIGFQSEEDWFEYQLESNPEFLRRIAMARAEVRNGLGVRLEEVPLSKGGLTTR